jgi:trehalose 6-phosphate phosphatase
MRSLLGIEGRSTLAALIARRPLLAFDFDGTLAPIVARPEEAHVPLPVAKRLGSLAEYLPVAVITGRAVDDVLPHLRFTAQYVVGNHGIEDPTEGLGGRWIEVLEPFRKELELQRVDLAAAGIVVEDKRQSIALHYRLASDHALALHRISKLMEQVRSPALAIQHGDCVFNVMASAAPDKGDALQSLVQRSGCDCGLFVGDDDNDEAAFAKAPVGWITVRVGPKQARTRAAYFLDGPSQLPALLQFLLDGLTPR